MSLFPSPFTMRGRIERCWLFSYRSNPEEVRRCLPRELDPLLYGGFAFWNLVLCRVGIMRPFFLPPALGISYWHVAYRIPARAGGQNGPVEGLYFVRSDCDSRLIAWGGNLVTDFRFHSAGVKVLENERKMAAEIKSKTAAARMEVDRESPAGLAAGSPFPDLASADGFLKYKPAALAVEGGRLRALKVGRDETKWKSRLVRVKRAEWDFLKDKNAVLEICQEVAPIEYQWHRAEDLT